MNIHDANRFIEAYNAQAKAAVLMATAWEELAWGMVEDHVDARGVRPAIPAQIIFPNPDEYPIPPGFQTQVEAAPTAEPVTAASPVAESAQAEQVAPEVSLVELRTLLAELSQAGLTVQVRGLITGLGFDKLSEVPEDKYAVLYAQAKELSDGSK